MKELIVCLGYSLRKNGSLPKILENRLIDCAKLCSRKPRSTLLLMGSHYYSNVNTNLPSQASAMKKYLMGKYVNELRSIKVIIEEETASSVEQICYLKKLLTKDESELSRENTKITIVSSEFFNDRVKLYVKYIFGSIKSFAFIPSEVPENMRENFRKVELEKYKKARKWLSGHIKGDSKSILKEQKEFQKKIREGKVNYPSL